KFHDLAIIIDRITVREGIRSRVFDAMELASKYANGKTRIIINNKDVMNFSEQYYCEGIDFSIPELEPRLFSFNTPIGACPHCNGLGVKLEVSKALVVNPEKGILDGGIIPYKNNDEGNLSSQEIEQICKHFDIDPYIPIRELPEEKLNIILYGSDEEIHFKLKSNSG